MKDLSNHIGKNAWKKLSYRQRNVIIKNRKVGRKLANGFLIEREKRLYPHKNLDVSKISDIVIGVV